MSKALCTAPLWKHLAKRGVSFCVWAHSISRLFAFIYHGSFKYPWIPTCIYIGIWNFFFSFSTFTQISALPTSKDKRSVICGKRKSYLLVNSFRYLYTMGGFICTIFLLISLSNTLQNRKFRNQFTISSKYFDMACYLKWEAYPGPISF